MASISLGSAGRECRRDRKVSHPLVYMCQSGTSWGVHAGRVLVQVRERKEDRWSDLIRLSRTFRARRHRVGRVHRGECIPVQGILIFSWLPADFRHCLAQIIKSSSLNQLYNLAGSILLFKDGQYLFFNFPE